MLSSRVWAAAQLQCSPSSVSFGDIATGQSETEVIVLTNSGQTSVTVSSISVSDSEFTVTGLNLPAEVAAGESINLRVSFVPTKAEWVGGNVTFSSNANETLKLDVEGTGVRSQSVTASPSILSFASVPVGASSVLPVVFKNTSSSKATLKTFQIAGAAFSESGPAFPIALGVGQSVTVNITFKPQSAGMTSGSVFISGPSLNIPLSGDGTRVGQLTVVPGALNFGKVDIGSTATQPVTLSASGGSITVSSATSNNKQFFISGISFPATISAGKSVTADAAFEPSQTGTISATVKFDSNASDPKVSQSLSGTGVSPQCSVKLSWNASTSPSIAGYNVYRGKVLGSYSKINNALDSSTSYTDSTVVSGVTYYYAAKAVNSAGQESGYSTPLKVVVP